MSAKGKVAGLATAGIVLGGGYVYNNNECLQGILNDNLKACMPRLSLGEQKPPEIIIGNLDVAKQELSGTMHLETFGQVDMEIGGDEIVMEYDDDSITDNFGDILPFTRDSAKKLWNAGGKSTQTIRFLPGIKLADDYRKDGSNPNATAPHPQKVTEGSSFEPASEAPKAAVKYSTEFDQDPESKTYQDIEKLTIEAGFLDAFAMHVLNTEKNKLLWSNPKSNDSMFNNDHFGDTHEATFRWIVDEIIISYGLWQACPEAVTDTETVKKKVMEAVMGKLLVEKPNQAELLRKALEQDRVVVNLEPPSKRQAYYQAEFEKTKAKIMAMDKTFPNPKNGKRYKMKKPQVRGQFAVKSCVATKAFEVRPTN